STTWSTAAPIGSWCWRGDPYRTVWQSKPPLAPESSGRLTATRSLAEIGVASVFPRSRPPLSRRGNPARHDGTSRVDQLGSGRRHLRSALSVVRNPLFVAASRRLDVRAGATLGLPGHPKTVANGPR